MNHTLKEILKKWVLRSNLNMDGLVQCLICLGREYKRVGTAEKGSSLQVRCLVLKDTERKMSSDDLRLREGVW